MKVLAVEGGKWKAGYQTGANSTLIRNAFEDLLGEDFEGRFESKYLARTIVEPLLDPSQVRIGDGDWFLL
ncbi:hypothetical protein, partial [Xanthomonas oryzae]|uniref:hypothetical protein n=1 Tax=Xanthomonas oryzae TaxID=347 RepID=UPI00095EC4F5